MGVDLDELRRSYVYTTAASSSSITSDLAAIRGMDTEIEGTRARFGKLTWVAVAGAIIGFFASAATEGSPVVLIAMGAAIAAAIVFGVLWRKAANRDVENRRYELVARVLRLLAPDLTDEPLSLTLDLRPSNHKSKFVSRGKVGPWKVKYFEDPWLELGGRLLDKTTFKLAFTERRQDRVKRQRNRRGKIKTKRKSKSAHLLVLRLKPKPERYRQLETIGANAKGAIRLPPFASLKGVSIHEGEATLKVGTRADWNAAPPGEPDAAPSGSELVAMMFLSLYQVLNLSREITKRAA